MNVFFGSIFIEKEKLQEAGINHPRKLEYYKIINEDQMLNNDKAKFGIEIIKTEYKGENSEVENKKIEYLSNDENKINKVLNILKENEVTPVCVQEIIYDVSRSMLYI